MFTLKKDDKFSYRVGLVREFLESFGIDLNDPQLKDTPERVVRMFEKELFRGIVTEEPDLRLFPNSDSNVSYDGMIVVRTDGYSLCAHHLVPIRYIAWVGYIPEEEVIGLSKISRIVDWIAKRPQIQELMTEQIADYLFEKLKPKGVGVYIEAQHFCMIMRGVKQENSIVRTTSLRGIFYEDSVKQEFLKLIDKGVLK